MCVCVCVCVWVDGDVGENRTSLMEINFKDINPVQLNYNSVPRDFLNKWKFIKQEVDSPF